MRWRALRRLVGAFVVAGGAMAALSVLWVLSVRFVEPPFTATMIQRFGERAWAGDGVAWVDHRPVPLEAMGRALPRAVVASEDGRFFVHHGFDWEGICAALEANRSGGSLRGGSTISQQVARNVFLVQRRSWVRKGLEVWFTAWLELLVPKERILELYLNVAETGPHHFGFEAAAQHWYGKPAAKLTAAEAARLASLLPAPRSRSPRGELADRKVAWVAANQVPFPGDPGFERLVAGWSKTPWPWACVE